nr:3'-5' exonuclease [Phycisphaerales bacterium]
MYSSHSVSGKAAVRRGQVVLREYPPILGDTRDKDALVMARCEFIARRVATIRDASPRASIGVLVRNKVSVSRLLMALSEEGVDATEEGGSSITQSPAVAAVVSLLRLADHPGDTLAAFHVATTPLGDKVGLSRRQDAVAVAAVSQAIREQITRHGFGQVVSQWVRWLAPACSEIDRTRLAQVSLAAWEHERRGGASIRGLISLIEATRRPVGVPSLVRVMTTHAAKGLEFDAVVAPDLDGIVPQRTPEVLAWRDDLLGPITRLSLNAAECVRRSNPILSALADDRRRRDIREGLCLLYVTMTRARHYLEMIIHRPPKEESTAFRLAHVVRYALGGEADEDGLIHSSGSEQWPC